MPEDAEDDSAGQDMDKASTPPVAERQGSRIVTTTSAASVRETRELMARRTLPEDVQDWTVEQTALWAGRLFTGVGMGVGVAVSEKLRYHCIDGQCLLTLSDEAFDMLFDRIGVRHTIKRARQMLPQAHTTVTSVALVTQHAANDKNSAGGDGDDQDDEEGGNLLAGIVNSAVGHITKHIAKSSRKLANENTKKQQVKEVIRVDEIVFTGNLSKQAANARMQQARVLGAVASGIEIFVSLSGSSTVW